MSSTALPLPCTELSLAPMSLQICFLLLFLTAEFTEHLKIAPADSISIHENALFISGPIYFAGFVHLFWYC